MDISIIRRNSFHFAEASMKAGQYDVAETYFLRAKESESLKMK